MLLDEVLEGDELLVYNPTEDVPKFETRQIINKRTGRNVTDLFEPAPQEAALALDLPKRTHAEAFEIYKREGGPSGWKDHYGQYRPIVLSVVQEAKTGVLYAVMTKRETTEQTLPIKTEALDDEKGDVLMLTKVLMELY